MTLESGLKKRIMTSLLRSPVRRRAAPPVDLLLHSGFWQQEESGAGILAEREEMQAPERSDYRSGSQRQLHLR